MNIRIVSHAACQGELSEHGNSEMVIPEFEVTSGATIHVGLPAPPGADAAAGR
jgi:hypothetical protein